MLDGFFSSSSRERERTCERRAGGTRTCVFRSAQQRSSPDVINYFFSFPRRVADQSNCCGDSSWTTPDFFPLKATQRMTSQLLLLLQIVFFFLFHFAESGQPALFFRCLYRLTETVCPPGLLRNGLSVRIQTTGALLPKRCHI